MDYEKVRYDRLNQVVKKAVEQTIKKLLTLDQIQACFPTISAMDGGPEALETARKQIQKYFHSTCFKQCEHIFAERDLEAKLNSLDDVVQAAQRARDLKTREPVFVDRMAVPELLDAALGQARADAERKLSMIYDQLVLDNKLLYAELQALSAEAEQTSQDVELQIRALAGGVDRGKIARFDDDLDALTAEVFGS